MSRVRIIACTLWLVAAALFAPAATDQIPDDSDDLAPPSILFRQEPQYTKAARKAKIEGVVVLNINISSEGVPGDIHVVKSLDSGLDQNAISAVSGWRFAPARQHGKPISALANVEVTFMLLKDQ